MARSVRKLMQAVRNEPTITVDDAAVLLSLSRHSAYEGVKAGQIPSIRIGRRVLVPCAGLRTMLGIERREPSDERDHRQDQSGLIAGAIAPSGMRSTVTDNLAHAMSQPLDATARAFISMIGNAAKASSKRGPTPSARRAAAAPPAEPPPAAPVDLNELLRRRRERERARRLEEFGRRNAEAFLEQRAVMAGNDADWRGW
jgi:excisionase family DNA binding protein